MKSHAARRGFVLVSVMALLVILSGVALATARDARLAVGASANRTEGLRLRWLARGCLARVRAEIDDALERATEGAERDAVWNELPSLLFASSTQRSDECQIAVIDSLAGSRSNEDVRRRRERWVVRATATTPRPSLSVHVEQELLRTLRSVHAVSERSW